MHSYAIVSQVSVILRLYSLLSATLRDLAASCFVIFPLLVAMPGQQSAFHRDDNQSSPGAQPQSQSQSLTIPRPEFAPAPSDAALEIPAAYLGCWQGAPHADAWHQYSGPPIEKWVPSTVTLCFVRQAGGVEVTYHKQSLDEAVNQGRIFNTHSQTIALASVGDHIALRSWGSAQARGRILGLFDGPTIDIKWMADANVSLLPDGATMRVDESMNQSCSGTRRCTGSAFVSAVWHGTLRKVPTL